MRLFNCSAVSFIFLFSSTVQPIYNFDQLGPNPIKPNRQQLLAFSIVMNLLAEVIQLPSPSSLPGQKIFYLVVVQTDDDQA